eukprot:TRINITY_DN10984_c0_g1_i2.p2 TRINITY_DN10984_c0_g1~~TRINITY_DN10984_c0_g1_i2.p2  ORF type:complete len:223 (+),score=28.63 TRINITY_DN10984_c0_g1_i2:700-1368(+)
MDIGGKEYFTKMGMVENLSETAILGRNFLVDNKAVIDCANRKISINGVTSKRKFSNNNEMNKMLEKFEVEFDNLNRVWTGSSKLKPMTIILKEDCKPIRAKPNRYAPNKRKFRLCVWFRHINKLVIRNYYPLPNPIHLIHNMAKSKVFTKIDKFNFIPMGFVNSSQEFQQEMIELIYSETLKEHSIHLRIVLDKIIEARIISNFDKCTWETVSSMQLGQAIL